MANRSTTQVAGPEGDNLLARFNPNGDEILFMSNRTGSWSIWTENMTSDFNFSPSSLANLLSPYMEFRYPAWSPPVDLSADATWNPNGLSILFTSSDSSGASDAFVLQPNVFVATDELGSVALGLVQTRISENITGANYACWTPDGEGVVLSNNQVSDKGMWIIQFIPVSAANPYGS